MIFPEKPKGSGQQEQVSFILPDEAVREFKELYKKRYNIKLSDKEASFRAQNWLNLYGAVYGDEIAARDSSRKTI